MFIFLRKIPAANLSLVKLFPPYVVTDPKNVIEFGLLTNYATAHQFNAEITNSSVFYVNVLNGTKVSKTFFYRHIYFDVCHRLMWLVR